MGATNTFDKILEMHSKAQHQEVVDPVLKTHHKYSAASLDNYSSSTERFESVKPTALLVVL